MPKLKRLTNTPDRTPMKTTGFCIDDYTRAMLRAIMDYEERSTESDSVRLLIRRAYRALPPAAQTVEISARPNQTETITDRGEENTDHGQ